jgi:hypothetical protein
MFRRVRVAAVLLAGVAAVSLSGCQKTDDTTTTLKVDDFVSAAITPNPATANGPGTGVFYRVVVGNNQPDETREYQYHVGLGIGLVINNNATSKSVALSFPVTITSASAIVHQAAGGIIVPPSSTDAEYSKCNISSSSGSTIGAVNGTINMNWDCWYTLPSQKREAVVVVTVNFADDTATPKTFTKTVNVTVAP